jgi:hypothetical protein
VGLGSTGVIRSNADKRGTGDVEKDGDAWGEGGERGEIIAGGGGSQVCRACSARGRRCRAARIRAREGGPRAGEARPRSG